jgi:hypothetical protein
VAHAALAGIHRSLDFFTIVFLAVVLSTAPPARPPAAPPVFSVRPWHETDGDSAHPATIREQQIVEHLRIRRGQPGGV